MNNITATYGAYVITKAENGTITVAKDGEVCANTAQAIRDIAKEANFDIDPTWNTRTAGAKLIKYLLTDILADELSEKAPDDLNGDGTVTLGEKIQYGLKQASKKAGKVVGEAKDKGKDIYDKASAKTKKAVSAAKNKVQELNESAQGLLKKMGSEKKKEKKQNPSAAKSMPSDAECKEWERFEENDKWGFKDKSGNVVIPCMYDYIEWRFENGRVVVCIDDKRGVINAANNIVIPIEYDRIDWEYDLHVFVVGNDGGYGLADTYGQFVLPMEYDECRTTWLEGYILLKKEDYAIVVGENGDIVRELPYDYIGEYETDEFGLEYALVRRDGLWGYLNAELEEEIPCVNNLYVLNIRTKNSIAACFDKDNLPDNIGSLMDDSPCYFEGHEHEFKRDQKISFKNIGALVKLIGQEFIWAYIGERRSYINSIDSIRVIPIEKPEQWREFAEDEYEDIGEEYSPSKFDIRYEAIEVYDEGLSIIFDTPFSYYSFRLLIPDNGVFDPSSLLIVNREEELHQPDQAEMKVLYKWNTLPYISGGFDYDDEIKIVNILWDGEECDYPDD